jgi:nucleoid-associated protein YgaU
VIPVQPAQPERWHVVKEGDSAFDIAKKYYGDGNLWKKLQEANGDRIAKNGAVRIGVRIKLPPAQAISGSASTSRERVIPTDPTRGTPSASSARPAPVEVLPKPVAASKVRTYTVVSGDTLIGIARKTLGSGNRADEIAALNKAKLRDRNTVVIGMTLQIPEK